jgi:hypothetical protein
MKILFLTLAILFNNSNDEQLHSPDSNDDRKVEFSIKKLEDIASMLPQEYLVERDTIMLCPDICGNKSIVIQYNEKHQVAHLGISMFSKETKEIINQPVCNFVERLLLELTLAGDKNAVLSMLDRNKITFQKNGRNFGAGNVDSISTILQEIVEPATFTLKKDDKSYTVAWEYGINHNNMLVIDFPLNRELILGTNKIESDNILYDQLKENNCMATADIKKAMTDGSLTSSDGTVFICKGDTFMFGRLNGDTYYKKGNNGYELIYDENFPKESLSNLFFGNFENKNLRINVTHSMYGNFSPQYEMKLEDFICFFKNDFNIYTASYQREQNEVRSIVIFHNKQYNYIHLLVVNTPKGDIFSTKGVISASFRSNIPQHNIRSLIGDLVRNN